MTFNMLCHGVKDMIFDHFNVVDVVVGSNIVLDPSFYVFDFAQKSP